MTPASGAPGGVTETQWAAAVEAVRGLVPGDDGDEVQLICHVNPDGDALGSMLGFGLALRRLGVTRLRATFPGEFEVPTLDNARARVKVAAGTQPGQRVRLKGKGMPILRTKDLGDLYVQLDVETPQNLSKRQRELLEEFEQASTRENSPTSDGFFAKISYLFRL